MNIVSFESLPIQFDFCFLDGRVETISGTAGQKGSRLIVSKNPLSQTLYVSNRDGPSNQALFNGPYGITIDIEGNIYITDAGHSRQSHKIRKLTRIKWNKENHKFFSSSARMEIKILM